MICLMNWEILLLFVVMVWCKCGNWKKIGVGFGVGLFVFLVVLVVCVLGGDEVFIWCELFGFEIDIECVV